VLLTFTSFGVAVKMNLFITVIIEVRYFLRRQLVILSILTKTITPEELNLNSPACNAGRIK